MWTRSIVESTTACSAISFRMLPARRLLGSADSGLRAPRLGTVDCVQSGGSERDAGGAVSRRRPLPRGPRGARPRGGKDRASRAERGISLPHLFIYFCEPFLSLHPDTTQHNSGQEACLIRSNLQIVGAQSASHGKKQRKCSRRRGRRELRCRDCAARRPRSGPTGRTPSSPTMTGARRERSTSTTTTRASPTASSPMPTTWSRRGRRSTRRWRPRSSSSSSTTRRHERDAVWCCAAILHSCLAFVAPLVVLTLRPAQLNIRSMGTGDVDDRAQSCGRSGGAALRSWSGASATPWPRAGP